jgi:hypothetical protein
MFTRSLSLIVVLVLLLVTISAGSSPSSSSAPGSATIVSPVYWGAWVPNVPWDMTQQDQFENMAQKGASIIHWGEPWQSGGAFQPFYAANFDAVRSHGSIPMLDWGSWNLGAGVNQRRFQLARISAGAYDSYITGWATSAKNWGHPFFLRFDWEMNASWFPWGATVNGNQIGDYVLAWRHVHDIFTAVGATNVSWIWCPVIEDDTTAPIAALYPGDAYVDWVAMDGYNWAGDSDVGWLTFSQLFQPTYNDLLGLAPSKPIMIGEMATSDNGGPSGYPYDKANWIGDALTTQLPANFPQIKAIVWFNWNSGNSALSWPIQTSQQAIDAFAQGIGSSYYASNDFANLSTLP